MRTEKEIVRAQKREKRKQRKEKQRGENMQRYCLLALMDKLELGAASLVMEM